MFILFAPFYDLMKGSLKISTKAIFYSELILGAKIASVFLISSPSSVEMIGIQRYYFYQHSCLMNAVGGIVRKLSISGQTELC